MRDAEKEAGVPSPSNASGFPEGVLFTPPVSGAVLFLGLVGRLYAVRPVIAVDAVEVDAAVEVDGVRLIMGDIIDPSNESANPSKVGSRFFDGTTVAAAA